MRTFFVFLIGVFCFCLVCEASQFKEVAFKYLTTSGAITTNNKAGMLKKIMVSSADAGDAVQILDGSSPKFTFIVPTNKDPIIWDAPDGGEVIFRTDIDCVYLTNSGNTYTTVLYREING